MVVKLIKNKKQGFQLIAETLVLFGAEGRTRTDTILLPLDFESCG
jgi:hypothetical protein